MPVGDGGDGHGESPVLEALIHLSYRNIVIEFGSSVTWLWNHFLEYGKTYVLSMTQDRLSSKTKAD